MAVTLVYNDRRSQFPWEVRSRGLMVSGHATKRRAREKAKREARKRDLDNVRVYHKSGGQASISV